MTFDPEMLLRTLNRHRVRYVMVGGLAAATHGSTLPTEDLDIAPALSKANLGRLASALKELGAKLRTAGAPDGDGFPCDAGFLAAQPQMLNLVTEYGDLDLAIAPAGFPTGFDGLIGSSLSIDFGDGVGTHVASLPDIIASKRAAGRAKNIAAIPYLQALAEETGQG